MSLSHQISNLSFQCAGIIALADIKVIPQRTVLTGTASWLDIFVIAPGVQNHHRAIEMNGAEWPAVGAMTSGYVFRIENAAMVRFLQRVGKSGFLTTICVSEARQGTSPFSRLHEQGALSMALYLSCCALTIVVFDLLLVMKDYPGILSLSLFVLARAIIVSVIKRWTTQGWKGEPEPGKESDLIVLLSRDRWIRIRGKVDDVKAVTSGGWFECETTSEGFLTACATLLVYTAVALVGSASPSGVILIVGLVVTTAGLLGVCNATTQGLQMYGRYIKVKGVPKKYNRRLGMAEELIKETGRDDWAIGLGMIKAPTPDKAVVATM